MNNQPTEESFLKDVAEHKMEILLDQGVYRHVRFARPGTNCYSFNLITGPGFLLYRGDMGCFEFERCRDMFGFFRPSEGDLAYHKSKGRNIPINLQYWSEKLEAAEKNEGFKHFSDDVFRRNVIEGFKSYAYDMNRQDRKALKDKIREELFCDFDDERDAFCAAIDFEFTDSKGKRRHPFQDFWEHDCKEYNYHFVWCCYAIVWGIMQYDQAKAEKTSEAA
jgi:hypothetical protein